MRHVLKTSEIESSKRETLTPNKDVQFYWITVATDWGGGGGGRRSKYPNEFDDLPLDNHKRIFSCSCIAIWTLQAEKSKESLED